MIRYNGDPTPEIIKKLIDAHDIEKYERLQNYYEGKTDILDRKSKHDSKPNNKLVSGYPSYIVDIMQGYFIGSPVAYSSENEELIEDLQDIFNNNDEQDENSELAKMSGIKGKSYEIVYMDEEANIRFNEVDADNIIMVYDTKISPDVNFAIRYYPLVNLLTDEEVVHVEVYTKDKIMTYKEVSGKLEEESVVDHYFNQVQIIEILNNDEGIGDFERVLTLIDAYEKTQSDTANDFEEFTDAFLCLINLGATDEDDIEELRKNKILLLNEAGQASWLVKEINDTALENYKNRLKSDIHKFSKAPDISDEQFSSNASGIAMAYKLLALEQVAVGKERKFKRALQKRIELICTALNTMGKDYDYRDVQITFTRNSPVNIKEEVETALMLRGFTSDSTALSQLPMVDNITLEQQKITKEKEDYIDLDKIEDDPEELVQREEDLEGIKEDKNEEPR